MPSFTKKMIMQSMMKLLDEKPLNKISVKDIVEECGINRNTFYYHFDDIPSLIEEIVKSNADEIINSVGALDQFEQCLDIALDNTLKYRRALWHIYNSGNRDIFERYLMNICDYLVTRFVDSVSEGTRLQPEDKAIIINSYKCECFGQIIAWLQGGMKEDVSIKYKRLLELRKGQTQEMIRLSEATRTSL